MLLQVLVALTVIITTARLMGELLKRVGQPPVIGEIISGIILGPSLLGAIAPATAHLILPPEVMPFVSMFSQLGVILFMFLIGIEIDLRVIGSHTKTTMIISNAGIVVPFALGWLLAWGLYATYAPAGIAFTPFSLFVGISMSITAFPVLARILRDRHLQRTPLGIIALTCAAVGDATGWCLLTVVVGLTQPTLNSAMLTLVLTVTYIALMLTLGRRVVALAMPRLDAAVSLGLPVLLVILIAALLSALAAELIGVHAIFGAFVFGAIIPHESALAGYVRDKIEDLVLVMFLPAFFAFSGLRTQILLMHTTADWLACAVITLVAIAGKFGGVTAAARVSGLTWRDSSVLGILMNTRGLVELIVLNIGLDLGMLTPRLFTILVLMALATTMMTSPLLNVVLGNARVKRVAA